MKWIREVHISTESKGNWTWNHFIITAEKSLIMQNKNNSMSNVNDKLIKMQIRGHKNMELELLKYICFEKILFFWLHNNILRI